MSLSHVCKRTLGLVGASLALQLSDAGVCRAQAANYQNSVHIDKNTGSLTINRQDQSTHNTFNATYVVQAGISEKTIKDLLEAADRKAGAKWEKEFKQGLARLNAEAANRQSELMTRLNTIDEKMSALEKERRAQQAADSDSERAAAQRSNEFLETLRAQQQQILDAILRGEVERARSAADQGERLTFDYDQRSGLGVTFLVQSMLFRNEGVTDNLTYNLGLKWTYDLVNFDRNRRHRLRLVTGFMFGWGTAVGGYAGPDGTLLQPSNFALKRMLFGVGIGFGTVLGRRGNIDLGPSIRGGYVLYEHETIPSNLPHGSMQLPIDVQLSYKPWAFLSLGVSVGAGCELFAWKPVAQYTGIGAETVSPDTEVRPFLEAGMHAAFRF